VFDHDPIVIGGCRDPEVGGTSVCSLWDDVGYCHEIGLWNAEGQVLDV
jgi:hypothetical protein